MAQRTCPKCGQENPEKAKYCGECGTFIAVEKDAVGETLPEIFGEMERHEEEIQAETSIEPESSRDLPDSPAVGGLKEETEISAGPPKAQSPPSMFGERYKIVDVLGSGRLGIVYHVFDKAFERDLALRLIKVRSDLEKAAIERAVYDFKKERRIVHKNIGRIFELSAEKDNLFLTMEYSPGKELQLLLIEKGRLPIGMALDLARQLSRGLVEAHRLESLHCDLRPGNIMIDAEGTARIMDLGVVKFLQREGILAPDFNKRWPEYLSPEQIEDKEPDARSDLYSLGLIFYEIFTGQPAFSARTPADLIKKRLNESPKIPRLINPLITEELSLLILKCLERDPEKRYSSAKALNSELEQIEAVSISPLAPVVEQAPISGERADRAEKEAKAKPAKKEKRDRTGWEWRKLLPAKRILIPVLIVIAAAGLGIFSWRAAFSPERKALPVSSPTKRLSVGILPLQEANGTPSEQDFGDGLTELIISGLKKMDAVFVPGGDTSFSLRGKEFSDREIALKCGVGHLFRATYQKTAGSFLLDTSLSSATDEAMEWSKKFERQPAEIRGLLDELIRDLVRSLGESPPEDAFPSFFKDMPASFEAFSLYVEGRSLLRKGGRENLEKAVEKFQKSAQKEPGSAAVQAALGEAYIRLGESGYWPPADSFPKAKIPVLSALEINPSSAEAQTLLAVIKERYDWDFAEAEKRFKEALRMEPNLVSALCSYAELLSALGRHEEAVEKIRLARREDPLSPSVNARLGAILYYSRRYDQAIEELNNALAFDPLNGQAHYYLGLVFIQTRQYDLAARSLQKSAELGADPIDVGLRLGYLGALMRRREEAGKALAEAMRASKQRYVSLVSLASVYAALFEKDQAFACLEKAFADRDPQLMMIKVHPLVDFLRREPWFTNLLGKLGLEKSIP